MIPPIVRTDIQVHILLNMSHIVRLTQYDSYNISHITSSKVTYFENNSGCYKRSESEVENGRPVYYKIDQDGHYTSRKFFYRSGGTGWEVQGLATLSKFDY